MVIFQDINKKASKIGHQEGSDVENLTTATMNRNKKPYKWCTSCNDGNSAWGYHWKIDHREWKENQIKNKLFQFSDSATNAVIYCSCLIPQVRTT